MEKEKNRKRKIQKLIWFDEREVAQIKLKMAQAGTTKSTLYKNEERGFLFKFDNKLESLRSIFCPT